MDVSLHYISSEKVPPSRRSDSAPIFGPVDLVHIDDATQALPGATWEPLDLPEAGVTGLWIQYKGRYQPCSKDLRIQFSVCHIFPSPPADTH